MTTDKQETQNKKEQPTDFNVKRKSTFAGFKEKKLQNCTLVDDVKAYREKYQQNDK